VRERTGRDDVGDDKRWYLARDLIRERCIQLDETINSALPKADNFFNSLVNPGDARNLPLISMQEVENPITFGGPEKMSSHVRWLRANAEQVKGLVSRFHGPWSDPGTLRTEDQMRFDIGRTIALGVHVSMGDHRYPDGHLEPEVYRRLAPIYDEVERLEPWLENSDPCIEAVVICDVISGTGDGRIVGNFSEETLGICRLLEAVGIQFDVLTQEDILPNVDVVICPGFNSIVEPFVGQLKTHVERGGAVIACDAALDGCGDIFPAKPLEWTPEEETAEDAGDMGAIGHVGQSDATENLCGPSHEFIRLAEHLREDDFPMIIKEPFRLIEATEDAEILVERIAPISDRPAFAGGDAFGPAVVKKGRVVYSSPNLFKEDITQSSPQAKEILNVLLHELTGSMRVEHDGGSSVVAHLHAVENGYALHLVHWAMDRRSDIVNSVSSFPRLGPIECCLCVSGSIDSVSLEPQGESLDFQYDGRELRFVLPGMHIWQCVGIR
jgi:hypothetical protein